ncbi:hypothetical protein QTO34_019065 [Cnephaeus nilssonii]|uniref:Uncharacterized protein n=1 Tax=Cnephaeus nilssonii TaxID=3371016 RepID=A0AA40I015_CNENI|nr:hypothetical protein QTO34_019065 [Eptesicus nilssonii]
MELRPAASQKENLNGDSQRAWVSSWVVDLARGAKGAGLREESLPPLPRRGQPFARSPAKSRPTWPALGPPGPCPEGHDRPADQLSIPAAEQPPAPGSPPAAGGASVRRPAE